MIAQLRNALLKALHNPRYLWYLWQNIDIIRDHFPGLYSAMQKSRQKRISLDLGGETVAVRRYTGAADAVVNGTLVELKPALGMLLMVR